MKRVLITGVAGFIGSSVADALLARGDAVTGLDDFCDYYAPAIKGRNLSHAIGSERFALFQGDICDEARVEEVFKKCQPEVVVHLAARAGVRPSLQDPNLYHRVNVIGSQHILDACRKHGPSHLVFASSSSVYGNTENVPFRESDLSLRPISPYGATKRMNELQAYVYHHVYGVNVTMLRFFTVYGPRQRPDMAIHKFVRGVLDETPIPFFGDGSTRRDYTYIDDIVDGVLRAVDRPFPYAIINLGESQTTNLNELVALIENHVGKRAKLERDGAQPGDVEITCADITLAREQLGYNPRFSMDEGIGRYVAWVREMEESGRDNDGE